MCANVRVHACEQWRVWVTSESYVNPLASVHPARLHLNKGQTRLTSEVITGIRICIYSLAHVQGEITDKALVDIPCLCWWVQKDQEQSAVILRLRESCN